MDTTFGFSISGLLFLLCLFVPNILYVFYPPSEKLTNRENPLLLFLERAGQVLFTILALVISNSKIPGSAAWNVGLAMSFFLLGIYLICWGRYFFGDRGIKDIYRPFLGVPIPLATLPVTAAFLFAIYQKSVWLMLAVVILGVGHVGITYQNWKSLIA